jgi:hypothetical protein
MALNGLALEKDFWILNDEGLPLVICEVKGKDNDLVSGDLIKFEANKDAAGKDEDFPSLLIANTHNKSNSQSKYRMGS